MLRYIHSVTTGPCHSWLIFLLHTRDSTFSVLLARMFPGKKKKTELRFVAFTTLKIFKHSKYCLGLFWGFLFVFFCFFVNSFSFYSFSFICSGWVAFMNPIIIRRSSCVLHSFSSMLCCWGPSFGS